MRSRREYLTAQLSTITSSSILLYNCFDSNTPLYSTEHTQVYFVLRKQRLWAAIVQLDTLFSFLCILLILVSKV